MTGLMKKDAEILRGNLKVFGAMFLIAIFVLVSNGNGSGFFVMYFTMISSMLVLNTISYDEQENGLAFLFTLPITRKTYVREKYLFGLIAGFLGWLIGFLGGTAWLCIRSPEQIGPMWLAQCAPGFLFMVFILIAMIPIQLKFGSENSKLIMIGAMAGCVGAVYVLYLLLAGLGVDFEQIFRRISGAGLPIFGAVCLAVIALGLCTSVRISTRILEKREF